MVAVECSGPPHEGKWLVTELKKVVFESPLCHCRLPGKEPHHLLPAL